VANHVKGNSHERLHYLVWWAVVTYCNTLF